MNPATRTWTASLLSRLRALRDRFPKVLILMYHRVIELGADPYGLCVTPRHFEEHLQVLRRYGPALSLTQLVQGLREGLLPPRGVAITLDDGYLDNLHAAKPLLEAYGVPATVFVPTGAIPMEREFWWDELARLLLQPGSLPPTLTVSVSAGKQFWRVGDGADYRDRDASDRAWTVDQSPESLLPRQAFFQSVQRFAYGLNREDKTAMFNQLVAWTGAKTLVRPDHRTLSVEELVELSRGELIEIGAHTVTHPVLPRLPLDSQHEELRASRTQLEHWLGRPVTSLSFPHGEYSAGTLLAARQCGFECAVSTQSGRVLPSTDPFQLPRFKVQDCDGERFGETLDAWLGRP